MRVRVRGEGDFISHGFFFPVSHVVRALPDVQDIHDLHMWSLTLGNPNPNPNP